MTFELLSLLFAGLVLYATKRYFDDKEQARKQDQQLSSEILQKLDELPKRFTVVEKATKEAIEQVFEFARATKESELKNVAKAAGVIAKSSRLSGGLPKP